MKVFTTINPNDRTESQSEAMNSWTSKYKVYSVNTKEEIEKIKDIYPNVEFIETEDTYQYKNKKLIKLNSILFAIESVAHNSHVAIVNSDIILNDKIKNSIFNKNYIDGMVIATRYEIGGDKIYPFTAGYDLFIFHTKLIPYLKNNKYVIGMPWWDYWLPLISISSGIKLYHIKNVVIFHRTHDTNYDNDIWITFGEFFYKDFVLGLLKNPIDISINDFCLGAKLFIEKNQINVKFK